mmetsp:Transcript_85394/g.215284  ORF Transcript_85394/g.215284 Transcript_85394/m.215284 type:complete len:246 (+) Transcript_85394:320-1057(+)
MLLSIRFAARDALLTPGGWPSRAAVFPDDVQGLNLRRAASIGPRLFRRRSAICINLATTVDRHPLRGFPALAAAPLHLVNDLVTCDYLPEDDMLAIQVWSGRSGNKELGAVGVGARIGHGEHAFPRVPSDEVLVPKLLAIDRLPTCAITASEISTLTHEAWNDAMEHATHVVQPLATPALALLARAEGTEVFRCLRHDISEQLEDYAANGLVVETDLKEDLGVRHLRSNRAFTELGDVLPRRSRD